MTPGRLELAWRSGKFEPMEVTEAERAKVPLQNFGGRVGHFIGKAILSNRGQEKKTVPNFGVIYRWLLLITYIELFVFTRQRLYVQTNNFCIAPAPLPFVRKRAGSAQYNYHSQYVKYWSPWPFRPIH